MTDKKKLSFVFKKFFRKQPLIFLISQKNDDATNCCLQLRKLRFKFQFCRRENQLCGNSGEKLYIYKSQIFIRQKYLEIIFL